MLTQHQYQNIRPGWDKDTVLDCCSPGNSGDPECVECCYDTWQKELKTVNQKYSRVMENANQVASRLKFITERRNKFRIWLSEINDSHDLALAICNQLEIMAIQSDKIWYNSCKAAEAVEILFCMIRDFFSQLDSIKVQFDNIQNCITNNTDPSLIKGQGILKALDEYKVNLDAVIKLRDGIIQNVVGAVQIVHLIRNSISTRECDENFDPCADDPKPCDGEGIFYGLKTIICEWNRAFACGETTEEGCRPADEPMIPQNQSSTQDECEDENCILLPTFEFPICSNRYKTCVEKWLEADEQSYLELSDKLQKTNKEKEALIACRNSLVKAIKAVDPKTRCN